MKTLLIILILALASSAYALDGQVSLEMDSDLQSRHLAPDFQANIGQALGVYRPFLSMEKTHETQFFPNSENVYRLGVEFNAIPDWKLESGLALYSGSGFSYMKATYSFDTAKWGPHHD
jgi:hypothetical protein